MKIAYFDCFAGASGDMIVGSLLDAGLDFEHLEKELKKLGLQGYALKAAKISKGGIASTKFDVETARENRHRHLKDIVEIIGGSGLSASVKEKTVAIFTRLAEAEARVHGCPVEEIHFHEVGAVDAIVDITGAVIGLEALNVDEVRTSRLHLGSGFVDCAHGRLPVPPPAVVELLKGIPVYSTDVEGELVTPTGAAVLSTLSSGFGSLPDMVVEKTGYGAGYRDLSIPNVLRLIVGQTPVEIEGDRVQLIETNIDDMNPQFYDYVMERLFAEGARDAFLTPVIMKKNRPGIVLSVVVPPDKVEEITKLLFRETTTLGVRISEIKKRMTLEREILTVETRWGKVRVKVKRVGDRRSFSPEYEDCKRIAREKGVPIAIVAEEIRREAEANRG